MRILPILVLSSGLIATAGVAAGPPPQIAASLRTALHSMLVPPGQTSRPADPDQGDDNAALIAITRVCNGDTPAAQRSAICPTPVSPS
jgi:hypothetical protein